MRFNTMFEIGDTVWLKNGEGPAVVDHIKIDCWPEEDDFDRSIFYTLDFIGYDKIADYEEFEIRPDSLEPKSVEDLRDGDMYCYLTESNEVKFDEYSRYRQPKILVSGNAFLTYADALKEAKRREIHQRLQKYAHGYRFTKGEENFSIGYDYVSKCVHGSYVSRNSYMSGTVYFKDEYAAGDAIRNIGEEKLIRDYFGIEDDEGE